MIPPKRWPPPRDSPLTAAAASAVGLCSVSCLCSLVRVFLALSTF